MKIIKTILVILRAVSIERFVTLKKRISFLFLIFLTVPTMEVFAEVSFRARVYSRSKNSGEANVRVLLFETKKFYQTDVEGYFQAVAPSSGVYTFRILKDTGAQEIRKEIGEGEELVILDSDQSTKSGGGGSKGSINVTGEREKQLMSRTKLRFEEIKRMPGTFGEPLRSIETIPGVVPVSAFGVVQVTTPSEAQTRLRIFIFTTIFRFYTRFTLTV